MKRHATANLLEDERSQATRATWLHFAGGLTQADVADRLGITSLKAHRLIASAAREGLVHFFIDGPVAECVQLETQISEQFRLKYCEVSPSLDEPGLPLVSIGKVAAQYMRRLLQQDAPQIIGIGHGRTLAACVDHLPRTPADQVKFVSLLGGLTRKFSANPHDVIHRLAERTQAEAYMMPVPFIANSISDRAIFLAQRGLAEVFDLAHQASLLLVGIGTVRAEASLVATSMIDGSELDTVKAQGGVGEILGHFFDKDGGRIRCDTSERIVTLPYEVLRDRKIIAIAGGLAKVDAILSVLRSGLLHGLITDELTAMNIMEKSLVRPNLAHQA
ncbi:MAG: sugar-binding transcriptional regulator [Candidatus Symbiobacter sp.]|nr:sugar-binding transcriptional regulator [Candidatus Symbiobacter sp.]